MKTVIVTLKGRACVFWAEGLNDGIEPEDVDLSMSIGDLEEDGVLDCEITEISMILEDVQVLYTENEEPVWDADDEGAVDITKSKGKYILVDDYFSAFKRLNKPFWMKQVDTQDVEDTFCIQLNDDEEFDPKKLHLIKSDYELDILPYGIANDLIVYDGKYISCDPRDSFTEDNEMWNAFIYTEKQPYASGDKAVHIKNNRIY